ncbi:MAG: response regulator [Anaerolineae bacterium]|nr:response regulator [Anaerolineae bacterium]
MDSPFALIIEDDTKLATIFSRALWQAGFETEIILDGCTALERLTATTPAVVLLDLHLPYASGIDILHHIRTHQRLAKTRVIIVTADLFRAEALRDEVDLVLLKPVSFTRLYHLATDLHLTTSLDETVATTTR